MDNHFEKNRKSWNELTKINVKSDFYDVDGFKKGNTSLNAPELAAIGSVENKSLLHLQCHFGLDTLSWARLGAKVTGIDISDEAIKTAKSLSNELQIPARFIKSNIYDLKQVLNEKFDVVFTSYGAINWLDDLNAWADIIHWFLKQGGMFYIIDFHPFIFTFNENCEIHYSYFKSSPIISDLVKSYTGEELSGAGHQHVEWSHSVSEIIQALITNGLTIEQIEEFPYQFYNCFNNMVEIEKGRWIFKKFGNKIPYMFSIKAVKC